MTDQLPSGYAEPQGDATAQDPPEQLDYEFWCGPSAVLPYMRARHHRWWRGHRQYGGGTIMDWIGHHNDIAHWGLGVDESGPIEVWTFPKTDIYDAPEHYEIRCKYAGGITSSISDRNKMGTKWIGEDGWVYVDHGKLEVSDPRWTKSDFDPGPTKAYKSTNHRHNFLECIKTRKPCIAPAETAHRSITPGHLAYVSQAVGRAIRWNPKLEQIKGDKEAEALLDVQYRKPWTVHG